MFWQLKIFLLHKIIKVERYANYFKDNNFNKE